VTWEKGGSRLDDHKSGIEGERKGGNAVVNSNTMGHLRFFTRVGRKSLRSQVQRRELGGKWVIEERGNCKGGGPKKNHAFAGDNTGLYFGRSELVAKDYTCLGKFQGGGEGEESRHGEDGS